jgi:hypothetical protein
MNDNRPGQAEPETLRQQYADVCKSHDAITDLRTKLLGLLPLAAGTGVFFVLKDKDKALGPYLGAIGLFGFAVTLGLFFYELRGMKECLQLRACGEGLERALGLTEDLNKSPGRFQTTRPRIIGPQLAGWMVYPAVLGAWLYISAVGFPWPQWVRLLLPILYIVVVTWRFIDLARKHRWERKVSELAELLATDLVHSASAAKMAQMVCLDLREMATGPSADQAKIARRLREMLTEAQRATSAFSELGHTRVGLLTRQIERLSPTAEDIGRFSGVSRRYWLRVTAIAMWHADENASETELKKRWDQEYEARTELIAQVTKLAELPHPPRAPLCRLLTFWKR